MRKAGFALSPDPDAADVILVNTCAFIEEAREEAVAELLRACELKEQGLCRAVVATGCFVQRYREQLLESFPGVDAWVGIDALDQIAKVVAKLPAFAAKSAEDKVIVKIPPGSAKKVFNPPEPALRFTGRAFAYLKIAEGCAHRCSYCAIPAIRGAYRSRKMSSILAEARELVATGVKELNVIAQDPMLYGVDLPSLKGGKPTLVTLLRAFDRLDGEFKVRVLYSYPSEITDEFLQWLSSSPRAIKYVDVPLQHTVPTVLKAMARGGAIAASLNAAERIRAAVPGVTLRTTLMTGFPGESESDFKRMLADVKRFAFDHLGAFAYSPEDGTMAAELEGRVKPGVAERRRQEIMRAQKTVWNRSAKACVGKIFPALVVADKVARLESQAPDVDGVTHLEIKGKGPQVGEVVKVKISAVKGYDFVGALV